jgi:DNA mismatch repair protein MutS2
MKQILVEWKRTDDKQKVMKQAEALLFRKREKQINERQEKKVNDRFQEIGGECKVGDQVKIITNNQVGKVLEIRDKRAIVKIGNLPMNVKLSDLVVVKERAKEEA